VLLGILALSNVIDRDPEYSYRVRDFRRVADSDRTFEGVT
jgi:hypothetical protein